MPGHTSVSSQSDNISLFRCFNLDRSWGTVPHLFCDKSNSSKEVSWVMADHTSVSPQPFSLSVFRCSSLDRSWDRVWTLFSDKSSSSKKGSWVMAVSIPIRSHWHSFSALSFSKLQKCWVLIGFPERSRTSSSVSCDTASGTPVHPLPLRSNFSLPSAHLNKAFTTSTCIWRQAVVNLCTHFDPVTLSQLTPGWIANDCFQWLNASALLCKRNPPNPRPPSGKKKKKLQTWNCTTVLWKYSQFYSGRISKYIVVTIYCYSTVLQWSFV